MPHAQLPPALKHEQQFQQERLAWAVRAALSAAFVAAVVAAVLFYDHNRIPMYAGFPEWEDTYVEGGGDGANDPTSLGDHFVDLGERMWNAFEMYFESLNDRHVAGFARFWAILATLATVPFTYRRLQLDRYALEGKLWHRALAQDAVRVEWLFLDHLVVAFTATAGCYMFHSALWVLLANMFKDLTLTVGGAVTVTGFAVGLTTFVAVHWALAVTIRDLFIFGLLTFVAGLSGSFAIASANPNDATQWWQHAISEVGTTPNSSLFFTFTLVSFAIIMLLFWNDFYKILRDVLTQVYDAKTAENAGPCIGVGFGGAIAGLMGMGTVPLMRKNVSWGTAFLTGAIHTGGVFAALILFVVGGMFILTLWMKHEVFPRYFKVASVGLGMLLIALGILQRLNEYCGFGILQLTAFELIALGTTGVWLIGMVDLVLDYAETLPVKSANDTTSGAESAEMADMA